MDRGHFDGKNALHQSNDITKVVHWCLIKSVRNYGAQEYLVGHLWSILMKNTKGKKWIMMANV